MSLSLIIYSFYSVQQLMIYRTTETDKSLTILYYSKRKPVSYFSVNFATHFTIYAFIENQLPDSFFVYNR